MANIKAVANGNWSNTATWDGGILPTSADDVFANGFTVTINGTFTVLSIRNTSGTGIVAGGQFIYANGGNLTCTAAQAIFVGSTTPTLEMTLASPNTATFNGSVLTMTVVNNYISIRHSSTGTLNLNGNYSIDAGGSGRNIISVTSTGTLNIVGNVSSTANAIVTPTMTITAAATVNITGNVNGTSTNTAITSATIIMSTGTLNITGNTNANGVEAISLTGSVIYNQIGNANASTSRAAIVNTNSAATIDLLGITTSSSGSTAVTGLISTFVKIRGNVVNTDTYAAIYAGRITIDNNVTSWQFKDSTNTITRTLYTAGVALGNPATSNVRFGTTYGASNELTGTLRVPSAANVLSGVLVDNTTGTLLMTPADFWNYLISSGFTANSIGDRLQNAATVATTGGQIASYNI